MAESSTPFAESVTKWMHDEFSRARLSLMALYTGTTIVLLGVFSYLLYQSLLRQLLDSFGDEIPDLRIQEIIFSRARDILLNRILIADAIVLGLIIIVGYILTSSTLRPVRDSLKRERRFVAHASHELRTPLAVLKTSVEVALRDQVMTVSTARGVLRSVLEEVNGLTQLANNLLEISKQKEKGEHFSNILLPHVISKVVKRLASLALEKHITLRDTSPLEGVFIRGNESMIEQMFYNIIHNAIMYTRENGEVRVLAHVHPRTVAITIEDTGVGISKDKLKTLFEPFSRGVRAHEMAVGSGLGLAIVKSIVDAHKGTISIQSHEGRGTHVTIELPREL